MLGTVALAYNLSTQEANVGGLNVQGQPGYTVRPCLKKINQNIVCTYE
jgi:hypothetical protein